MGVIVGDAGPQGDDGDRAEQGTRRGNADSREVLESDNESGEGETHRHDSETASNRVGPLGTLADFEAIDPRDSRDASDDPCPGGGSVDDDAGRKDHSARLEESDESPSDLGQRNNDEYARQLWMLCMESDCPAMDDTGPDRGKGGN
jgi:hypothetical protein